MAMMLSPPGLFSTTTGWPHLACSFSASSRAPISAPAPGPNGTMNFTARVGQFCAWFWACTGTSAATSSASAAPSCQTFRFMDRPRSELGGRTRQQLPVRALLLPVHQDVQLVAAFLAVGERLAFAHP